VTALNALAKILDDIRTRSSAGQEIQIIGMVVRLMKDAMREAGLPNENRELIIQSLVMKIEEEDLRKKRLARTGAK
jgi:truncated hemoglobin YjbI